jgi:thiol:disulfide interchange protein
MPGNDRCHWTGLSGVADRIALVDVDVYDERNASLVRSAGVRAIPTLIFFDKSGSSQMHLGVMEAGKLRQALARLGAG